MRKLLFMGLFLLFPILLNSNAKNDLPENKSNLELIEEQCHNLEAILTSQLEADVFLVKHKMYNRFTLYNKIDIARYCDSLGIDNPVWLYKGFYKESRGNPKAVNKTSLATGIIGWLPSTAERMGMVNVDGMDFKTKGDKYKYISNCIKDMSMDEQIKYTYEYYKPICKKHKLNTQSRVYLALLHPAALSQPDSLVVGTKDSKLYTWNKSFDANQDSIITVHELKLRCM